MATQVQFRRGTTTQNNAFTGAAAEITYDTEVKTLRLHDGTTAGGGAIVATLGATQTFVNKTLSTGSAWQGNSVALAYGGTGSSLTAVQGAVVYSGSSGLGLSAAGTSGQVLTSGGTSSPVWVNASALTVGTATAATSASNILGGSAGYLMYQVDTNQTGFIAPGTTGYLLRSTGASTAPDWVTASLTIGSTSMSLGSTYTSIAGLTAINATSGATAFFATPTSPALFAAGTAVTIGAATGTLTVNNPSILGASTTQAVFNTVATTVNAFGAATTINVGAATGTLTINNPIVVLNSTKALQLPVGDSAARPTAVTGQVRYNSELSTFEGYGGSAWGSLGGVKSVDGFTYILAETSAGASNGELEFYVENAAGTGTIKAAGLTRTKLAVLPTTTSTSSTTGALTVAGGAGIAENLYVGGNTVITGDLTVNGTTTTVNSTTVSVDDKNIELGSVATPTDVTADGGGITLKGATDKTFNWVSATSAWTSSEHLDLASGKSYFINGTNVLSATTLGTGVLTIGATSGTLTLLNPTIVGGATTQNLFNTVATTLNIGGAATTLSLGAATGTTTVNNGLTVTGTSTLGTTNVSGITHFTNATETTQPTNGSVYMDGGLGIAKDLRVGGTIYAGGNGVISGNITITGNMTVTGTTTTNASAALNISDSVVYVGDGNPANALDIGLIGSYNVSGVKKTGIVKDHLDSTWKFFSNPTNAPASGTDVDFTGATYDAVKMGALAATNGTFTAALTYGGVTLSNAVTGTGNMVLSSSPTLVTPTLGVASATSVNKLTITTPATGSTLTIDDGKTLTVSNTLTFTGTDASSVAFGTGGTVAYVGNKLSVFAPTTSAELAGVITDETGTGALVFGTAPAFTTSIDGGATFSAFGSSSALTIGFTGTGASSTHNLATAALTGSFTKTINIGTGGTTGSTTAINLGSPIGSTTTVNGTLSIAGSTSGAVKFVAPATAGAITYTLPSADATVSGYALVSNGSATLSWAAAGATLAADTSTTTLYLGMSAATTGAWTAAKANTNLVYNASTNILSTPGLAVTASTASTTASTGALIVTGGVGIGGAVFTTGNITSAADIISNSDRRMKSDIQPITSALEKVQAITGVTFIKNGVDRRTAGVIAQDVLAVHPEVVHENEDGMLSVSYGNMVGLLIEAIKEQQEQINELKAKLGN
jgi:hypothetical protein